MIGKIKTGKSMRGCLGYCMDKKLAEVLDQNLCGGSKKEILEQMKEVRELNNKVEKSVQHITLSMAPGEKLNRGDLIKLSEECAKELGFAKNQYVVIQHHDTEHQHIHIVINRIGLDGKTLSDSNNYKKIADFCRRMEEKFRLKKVQTPRRFQKWEERQLPRSDERKKKLKSVIIDSLWKANSYEEFAWLMNQRGYEIDKARGIAFIDRQKVRTKGSEVGYPLSKIERILSEKSQNQALKKRQKPSLILSTKISTGQITKKQTPTKESVIAALTEKKHFEENIHPQFKKKRHRQRRQLL